MTSPAARGRCWGGSIACSDCSDHIYQYAKFGACFQKCTNIVLSHWTIICSVILALRLILWGPQPAAYFNCCHWTSVYLSICLSVHLSICPSVHLSICLSVWLSVRDCEHNRPVSVAEGTTSNLNIYDKVKKFTLFTFNFAKRRVRLPNVSFEHKPFRLRLWESRLTGEWMHG